MWTYMYWNYEDDKIQVYTHLAKTLEKVYVNADECGKQDAELLESIKYLRTKIAPNLAI